MKIYPESLIRLVVLAVITATSLQAGPERHLFLAPSDIARYTEAVLTVNPPGAREVVIRADRPWEQSLISFYTTVIEENGKIRLWYICRDIDNRPNVAYAESTDGVNWTKPDLGIVDYHGSTANNLVGITSLDGAVFRDPQARPGEEYVYVGHLHGEGVFRYHSPDGLHWTRDSQPLLPFRADTQNIVFWDTRLRSYVFYLRGWELADKWEERLRKIVRFTALRLDAPLPVARSGRGDNPTKPEDLPRIVDEMPTVLAADACDPAGTDVYNISAQNYPPDPQWYVGFPSFFRREKHISDGRLEVHFVGSRDGIVWERYDRQPYVPLGLADSNNANMVFIGPGIVVRGDELWQYGTGFRNRHGAVEKRKKRADGVIYRYVQRLDGFVSLDLGPKEGRCEMNPVRVDGPRLLLNADVSVLGELRVELLDAEGKTLPGFTAGECDSILANSTSLEVTWAGRSDLSALDGREVTVVFTGRRTKLYSFRFDET